MKKKLFTSRIKTLLVIAVALAIITTVCCCLPFGIVAIIKASSVNSLYMAGNYTAAMDAAAQAKRWSLLGIGIGAVVSAIYFVIYFIAGLGALS